MAINQSSPSPAFPIPSQVASDHRDQIMAAIETLRKDPLPQIELLIEQSYVSEKAPNVYGFLALGPSGFYAVNGTVASDGSLNDLQAIFLGEDHVHLPEMLIDLE